MLRGVLKFAVLKSLDEQATDDMNYDNGSHLTQKTKDEKLITTSQKQKGKYSSSNLAWLQLFVCLLTSIFIMLK